MILSHGLIPDFIELYQFPVLACMGLAPEAPSRALGRAAGRACDRPASDREGTVPGGAPRLNSAWYYLYIHS